MSKNTVKPALTPNRRRRVKRVVENDQFDAFARRILRAYARRVAAGDVEALRSLAALSAEVDAVTRLAVLGLKQRPYAYSWSEIADRLGVSRQAAQMRYGDRTDRGALDRRLVAAGLGVSVAILVEVFADHHPGSPAASVCPGCGYRYPDGVTDCPTNSTVRPVLYRRRGEDTRSLNNLSSDQFADLHNIKTARAHRAALVPAARRADVSPVDAPALFDLTTGAGTP
jgi:DNA-binding Lrp family transcriptional regulator